MTSTAAAIPSLCDSRLRTMLGLVCLMLTLAAAGLGPITPARADEWAQATCSDAGEPVPTEGWVPSTIGGYPANTGDANTCAQSGGSLSLRDEATVDQLPESGPMWVYNAPAFSTIAGGFVTLTLASPGGQAYLATPANETTAGNLLLMCIELCTSVRESTASIWPRGGSKLFAVTECNPLSGKSVCSSGEVDAQMNIKAATILLSSEAKPTAGGFAGTLLDVPTSGTASLAFTAHDEHGPGVYRATVQIDGHTVWSATPDLNEGECVAHGTYEGALKFHDSQPCPQETAVHTEIPTSELAEGQHTVKVEVEDAAGNKATVYSGTIMIDNQPPAPVTAPSRGVPNGNPASDQATVTLGPRQPRTFTRPLTHSAITLTGRLTSPSGAPIQDALVQLLQQVAGTATMTPIATATTGSNGAWTLRAPKGPSRLLRVAYYSHTLDTTPAASVDVHESVPAVISMHAPHRARLGHPVVFRGQLTGGYVPPDGESVQMEILYAGRWRTIEVLPTSRRGQWAYKYVFSLGSGSSFLFRAATIPNEGYPFLSNHSSPVRITVTR